MADRRIAKPLPLAAVQWTRGFWADRFAACRDVMIPAMARLMTETERHRFLGNFLVAAGKEDGRHRGPKWDDGDFYKLLEGAAAAYAHSRDPKLDRLLDQAIEPIAAAQRDDGYIHTATQIKQRTDPSAKPFADPMDFEMYNMGHLMSAACVHHRATGKKTLLSIAQKAADFLDREFAVPTGERARHGICPSHLVGLTDLARSTNERRYADLARRLLDMRDLVQTGDDDNQDRVPFRQQRTAHGHAVRATYLYTGAADVYAETGDDSLMHSLRPIWDDLVSRKLYITGGCGALFDGASPDGATDQSQITRVHQAFGRDYQLPNSIAHNETCAAIGNLMWNWRMFLLSGEAKYADLVEHTFYNSVLAGAGLDGESFFYTNTLRQLNPMPVADLRWPRQRQKSLGTFCCPPNVVRTIARSAEYAYAAGERCVWVVMYGSNRANVNVDGVGQVELVQETDYPWSGKVAIRIQDMASEIAKPGRPWSLRLRIPEWCREATARVNGVSVQGEPHPALFFEIEREWKVGDVVELDLPMPVRTIEANPLVEETRNHIAIARGPIVYCLESVDLPAGVRVMDVHVPIDAKFVPDRGTGALDGFTVLRGRAVAIDQGNWSGRLYRDAKPAPPRAIDVTLIPYFAWANRGESEMSVWLPIAR